MIYLDNAASTKTTQTVNQAILTALDNHYANPSSTHAGGLSSVRVLEEAKSVFGNYLGVSPDNIIFTSGGTESNNIAILGSTSSYRKGRLITQGTEHSSVKEVFSYLCGKGFEVVNVNVNRQGQIDTDQLLELITSDTLLISIMHVNNETGAINDVDKIAEMVKNKFPNVLFHTDCVASFGRIPIDTTHIDYLSASAHKVHGPKGVGLLLAKKTPRPIMFGGGQQNKIRPGTINIPLICGFKQAILEDAQITYVKEVRQQFLQSLQCEYTVNSPQNSSPFILNLSFPKIMSEVLQNALSLKGVYVSKGSACSGRGKNKGYVLKEMGLRHENAVRFSFSKLNTLEEAVLAAQALSDCVKELRRV